MKKLIFLMFLAIGITGCSVESVDSTDNIVTADLKAKAQEAGKSMHLLASEICFGEAPIFVFDFPQDAKGNGDPKDTDVHIQLYNAEIDDWESFKQLSYDGSGPEEYTYEDEVTEIGTYSFRAKIGSGGFDYLATLDVVDCSDCEESFSYLANENGSYTFTYIPEEDIAGAEVVFTLAQSEADSGLEGWEDKGATKQKTMDFVACEVYEWTVTLTPDCNGNTGSSNVWTDFKVNDVSKKNKDTPSLKKGC